MAPYETDDSAKAGDADDVRTARQRAARYVVPVTVIGVAAATIGLVPAFAGSGDPDLPKVTAQELIEKIAASDVERLSGTVKISTDLGLPSLGGLENSLGGAAGDRGSSAEPSAKLLELASGTHTLRVAADGPDKQKLSVLDEAAEYSVIRNGDEVWTYDSASNEVFHATGAVEGKDKGRDRKRERARPGDAPTTPQRLAEEALKAVDDTTSVTVDGTAQVAGRDAYKLLIEPKGSGSTIGAVTIAVDSETGLPLKFTLTPASGGAAVVDAGFTKIDFSRPSASTFDFTPPKGAKVTEADEADGAGKKGFPGKGEGFGKGDWPGKGERFGKDGERFGKDGARSPFGGGPRAGKGFGPGGDGFETIGEGWNTIARFETGGGGVPSSAETGNSDVDGFLGSFGDKVKGDFGSGTVFSTRLINVLITDDGTMYAGAVTKAALVKAANAAE